MDANASKPECRCLTQGAALRSAPTPKRPHARGWQRSICAGFAIGSFAVRPPVRDALNQQTPARKQARLSSTTRRGTHVSRKYQGLAVLVQLLSGLDRLVPPLKKRDRLVLAPLIDVLARKARVFGDLELMAMATAFCAFALTARKQLRWSNLWSRRLPYIKGAAESIQVVVGVVRATITRRDDVKYMLPLGGISRLELNQLTISLNRLSRCANACRLSKQPSLYPDQRSRRRYLVGVRLIVAD